MESARRRPRRARPTHPRPRGRRRWRPALRAALPVVAEERGDPGFADAVSTRCETVVEQQYHEHRPGAVDQTEAQLADREEDQADSEDQRARQPVGQRPDGVDEERLRSSGQASGGAVGLEPTPTDYESFEDLGRPCDERRSMTFLQVRYGEPRRRFSALASLFLSLRPQRVLNEATRGPALRLRGRSRQLGKCARTRPQRIVLPTRRGSVPGIGAEPLWLHSRAKCLQRLDQARPPSCPD